jgi:hypothetical protein
MARKRGSDFVHRRSFSPFGPDHGLPVLHYLGAQLRALYGSLGEHRLPASMAALTMRIEPEPRPEPARTLAEPGRATDADKRNLPQQD